MADVLRDRAAAKLILDPADPRFVTGSEDDRTKARAEWHRQRFTHQVMSSGLEEIPRSRLQPLRGVRLLEDTATGDFYLARTDGFVDLDFVPTAVAFYCADNVPVLLEKPAGVGVKNRAQLEQRQAERERRRNAPKPPRQARRR